MTRKQLFLSGLIVLTFVFGILPYASGGSSEIEATKLIVNYRSWKKANDTPVQMSAIVSALCRPVTAAEKHATEKDLHKDKFITVYVNEVGLSEFTEKKAPHFPEGTVIVKEKLPAQTASNPELLTVMVKRKRGFDSANGDWEYLTFNGAASRVTSFGKIQSCQECHADQKSEDYVFRSYLTVEAWKKMK